MCLCENTVSKMNWKGNLVKNPENIWRENLPVFAGLGSDVKHLILTWKPNILHLNFLGSEAYPGLFSAASTGGFPLRK